jgi:hypothetical protein
LRFDRGCESDLCEQWIGVAAPQAAIASTSNVSLCGVPAARGRHATLIARFSRVFPNNPLRWPLALLIAAVGFASAPAIAGEGATPLACARRDLVVREILDEHRYAQDVAPDRLAAVFMSLIRARQVCERNEAQGLALYDDICFDLQLRSNLHRAAIGPMD